MTLIDERPVARARAAEAPECDVAIVGAGPYGLSAAAHLGAIDGLDVRIFGPPMSFWERNMPAGMLLRSPWVASNLSHPGRRFTLDEYRDDTEQAFGSPVPLDRFVDYGRWFQRQTVPGLDGRTVRRVEARTATGSSSSSRTASRCARAAWSSPPGSPPSPTARRCSTRSARGSCRTPSSTATCAPSTAGGSSSPAAARARSSRPRCCARPARTPRSSSASATSTGSRAAGSTGCRAVSSMLYAWPDVGPAGVSHLVARPALWRRMPRERQDRLARRAIRPAGAAWLVPRLRDVPIRTGVEIAGAEASAGRLRLRLSDGSEVTADHLLLGTGYRVDVARYAFLARDLVARVAPRRRPPAPHARLREHRARPALRRRARRLEPRPAHALRRRGGLRGPLGARATSWPRGTAEPWPSPTPRRAPGRGRARREAAPAGALVLGADYRALGVVRSLGRRGVPVLGDPRRRRRPRRPLALRAAPPRLAAVGPGSAARVPARARGRAARTASPLIPSGDETAAFVARHHDALSARYARDDAAVGDDAVRLRQAPDVSARRRARARRIRGPPAPRDRADLDRAREIRYPVVLKPAVKETFNRLTAAKAWRVDDRAALLRRYDEAVRARRARDDHGPGARSPAAARRSSPTRRCAPTASRSRR